jgi:hypothetical protein
MLHPPVSILVIEDLDGVRSYKLQSPSYTLGRSSSAAIRIHSASCSRYQSTLVQVSLPTPQSSPLDSYTTYKIYDGHAHLKKPSTNGTLVNGHLVYSQVLKHQDVIYFGAGAKATFLLLPTDLIPTHTIDLETIAVEPSLVHKEQAICYVGLKGEVVVTQPKTLGHPRVGVAGGNAGALSGKSTVSSKSTVGSDISAASRSRC